MNSVIFDRFIAETWEQLTLADAELASLERAPVDAALAGRILLRLRAIEKSCQPFGLTGVRSIANHAAGMVAQLRDGSLPVNPDTISQLREAVAEMKEFVGCVEATGSEPGSPRTVEVARHEPTVCDIPSDDTAHNRDSAASSVLVVDSSMFFRHLVTVALESRSYSVTAVDSALDAVDLFQAGKSFRAVVSEIELPEMSGFEFAQWLRNRHGETSTPLIALTTGGSATQRSRALNAGFDCFLTKFNAKQLYYAMVDVLSPATPIDKRKCA